MRRRTVILTLLLALALALVLAPGMALASPSIDARSGQVTGPALEMWQPGETSNASVTGLALWDQLQPLGDNSILSQENPTTPTLTAAVADDFVNEVPWEIDTISIQWWVNWTALSAATSLTWQIYADDGGVPDGNPWGGSAPVWTLTLPVTDAQVTIDGTASTGDGEPRTALLTLAEPIELPAGHWWLVPYVTMGSDMTNFFWYMTSTTNEYASQIINPSGYFGLGTEWYSLSLLGYSDAAFRLDGRAVGSPYYLKSHALSELEKLLADGLQPAQKSKVSAAADSIAKSLDPALWQDQFNLQKSSGTRVFDYESAAARSLLRAHCPGVSSALSDLVEADRLLASEAIEDAVAAGGNASKIAAAKKCLLQGDRQGDGKGAEAAIGYYRSAWSYAVKAWSSEVKK